MTNATTTAAKKTMSCAQMAWSLKNGFAWADPADASDDDYAGCGTEVFWTREGGYIWDVDGQNFIMEL